MLKVHQPLTSVTSKNEWKWLAGGVSPNWSTVFRLSSPNLWSYVLFQVICTSECTSHRVALPSSADAVAAFHCRFIINYQVVFDCHITQLEICFLALSNEILMWPRFYYYQRHVEAKKWGPDFCVRTPLRNLFWPMHILELPTQPFYLWRPSLLLQLTLPSFRHSTGAWRVFQNRAKAASTAFWPLPVYSSQLYIIDCALHCTTISLACSEAHGIILDINTGLRYLISYQYSFSS